MGKIKLEFNSAGFRALLNSPEVEALVLSEAEAIANRANQSVAGQRTEGFRSHSRKAGTRVIAFAGTTDRATIIAEAEDKALSRAVIPHG